MEHIERPDHLNENGPNLLFFKLLISFLHFQYLLVQVRIIGEVHHQAQT
jgi:hypothetical protein